MKTIYLLYISAGVALATIYYLYKSHKETMKKIEVIQNLVSSIQQVPVMKYNDAEIQGSIKTRCDDIEELIHFVNDEINTKLDKTLNLLDNKQNSFKQNNVKTNIPKTFFSEFIDYSKKNDSINLSNSFEKNKNKVENSSSYNENEYINLTQMNLEEEHNDMECIYKNYQNEPILNIENIKSNDQTTNNFKENDLSGSLSNLNKTTFDLDSVHNSSCKTDKNLNEEMIDNDEDLNETYDLNSKLNINLELNIENNTNKSVSNNIKEDIKNINSSISNSLCDNSKIPKLQELKQIAKSKDLSTNGNKKEIIQRLIDNGYIF